MKFEKAAKILEKRIERSKATLLQLQSEEKSFYIDYRTERNKRRIAVAEVGLAMTESEKETLSRYEYGDDTITEFAAGVMAKYGLTEEEYIELKDVYAGKGE